MTESPEHIPSFNPEIPKNLKAAVQQLYVELEDYPQFELGSPDCISGIYFLPIEAPESATNTVNLILSMLQEQFQEMDFDYDTHEHCITITLPNEENGPRTEIDTIAIETEVSTLLNKQGHEPITLHTEDGKGIIFILNKIELDLKTADDIKQIEKKYTNISIRVVIDEFASTITIMPL